MNCDSRSKNKMALATVLFAAGVFWGMMANAQEKGKTMTLIEARKIWDKAPHNAFTDIVRFQERWFCVFREGKGHVSPDGALRVITSVDGEKWESAALITSTNSNLRDAKIAVTPDGQLMLCGAEALHDKSEHTHQSLAWFSKDGRTWSDKIEIGDPDFWLWRVTWHKGKAYGIGYGCGKDRSVRLYSSNDGRRFDTVVERLFDVGYPNETSLVFDGDTAYCLLRRDGNPLHGPQSTGLLGVSVPPYTEWEWKDIGVRIGGPKMILLADGRLLVAVRLYSGEGFYPARTSLGWIDRDTGRFSEALELPSGGDTSYAGLVLHDEVLWVSYYSSHEDKTSIYLAKVKIAEGPATTGPENIVDRRQLFVDRALIGQMNNMSLKLHEPVSGGVAIGIDKPWEGPANMGMSVIHHGGRYLMYYRGFSLKDKKEEDGVGCVAESRDGVTWSKPALNLVSRPEWPDNNIIATDDKLPAFAFPCAPWVDTRSGVPANERIKMVKSHPLSGDEHTAMKDPAGPKRLVFWCSADGFAFRRLDPQPEFISNLRNCFDSGNSAALGYARQSGIPLDFGFIRNHYVGRTFIMPEEGKRESSIDMKLAVLPEVVKNKRVIMVDDSIIRGNTARKRIQALREAGAKEVHVRVSCPPTCYPCFFGIDFPTKEELIAGANDIKGICEFMGCDSLGYLSLEGLLAPFKKPDDFCTACFTGRYPLNVGSVGGKLDLEPKRMELDLKF